MDEKPSGEGGADGAMGWTGADGGAGVGAPGATGAGLVGVTGALTISGDSLPRLMSAHAPPTMTHIIRSAPQPKAPMISHGTLEEGPGGEPHPDADGTPPMNAPQELHRMGPVPEGRGAPH